MLMECFCEDIGIKAEQLTQAIKSDKAKSTTQLDQVYIYNYYVFKKYNAQK